MRRLRAVAVGELLMDEEITLIEYLRGSAEPPALEDDLHRRLCGALSDPAASNLDRAVLVRQLLRRWSLRDGRDVPVELSGTFSKKIRHHQQTVGLRERVDGMWSATPWRPDWMEFDGGEPDTAALAGTAEGVRFRPAPAAADPFFVDITGFGTYRTPGQRAACRAVMTAPEGSTLIAMLPTGSGKTEVALCLSERARYGVTVIVVPTVALAYDFERRFRDHFARKNRGNRRFNADALYFAWTASTDEATRATIKDRITQGQQRLLVTSPESITRALRQTLLDAASIGRLQGFVVDEAHLITQWGRIFRPEFRTLADLRQDLLHRAEQAGHPRAVTLLLSATLGDAEMRDLLGLFAAPGPCSLVVANALRGEPDLWIAPAVDEDERTPRVLDTLAHSARPAVLYVTSPDAADRWLARLREAGYARIASVTGNTGAKERAAVLHDIHAEPGSSRALDLVVATSAFGLGIDYPHIRTVVHACLPETVDRWYQELGRGGRDGDACAAFLLASPTDDREARSLGVKVLSPETAEARWRDMWDHKKERNGRTFVDLEGARGSVGRGDYNRRWNAQVIQGLIELGELERVQFDVDDIRELMNRDDVEVAEWTAISRVGAQLGTASFWQDVWLPWQQREMANSFQSLTRIHDVSRLAYGACDGIAGAYAPGELLRHEWGARLEFMEPVASCGRCPECRRHGVPVYEDPPPSPRQSWAVPDMDGEELARFVTACRGVNGLAVLTYSPDEADLGPKIATGLFTLGVRHFAGLPHAVRGQQGEACFFDELPLSPADLSPVASFSYFAHEGSASRRWLSRREVARMTQAGYPVADVLLVPEGSSIGGRAVGRDIPSLAGSTALELLPRS
jgi:superfamily II DNA/RNA helicase